MKTFGSIVLMVLSVLTFLAVIAAMQYGYTGAKTVRRRITTKDLIVKLVLFPVLSGLFGLSVGYCFSDHPPLGWTTTGTVTNIVDGDTVDIEIRRTIRVRMLDCWAPEQHNDPRLPKEKQAAEKKAGLESKANLKALALGKPVTLHVPTDGSGDVAKLTTMGRVLGTVWLEGSDKSLNQLQVEGGFATKTKREELK